MASLLRRFKPHYLLALLLLVKLFTMVSASVQSADQHSPVQLKKQRFEQTLVPAVERVHREWQTRFDTVAQLLELGDPNAQLQPLRERFGAASDRELLAALKPHPVSIVLAQAAIESGWGTSRFYREANNVFGIWSSNRSEPRIAARGKRDGKTVWLKQYASLDDSIRDYYRLIAKGAAYQQFRQARLRSQDPLKLVPYLTAYSERREAYTRQVSQVLRQNQFSRYDQSDDHGQWR